MPTVTPPKSSSRRSFTGFSWRPKGNTSRSNAASGESPMDESEYSIRARALIALVNDLKDLGGDQFDLNIPCLAFIGNQSAGKSSVVEGATGIPVPRDSGTCTKCPMRCTLMRTPGSWSCEITLQFAYDKRGLNMTPPLTVPFKTVSNPKDVEIWLRRAQTAILCPDTDPSEFYAKSAEDLKRVETRPFSPNTVELLVRDPEGTDLSFVDLPGIIQHHTKDDGLVPFVKDLVERHIRQKNTLIVVTIPMTDDIENQEAFRIASRADPAGLRTIGVGTKPDMLPPGSLSALASWKTILEGGSANLKHGYYAVRLPNDKERQQGLSRSRVRAIEAEHFDNTAPWKDITDRSRLGLQNFVENASKLLISFIETNLPTIKRTVQKLLSRELEKLNELPPLLVVDIPLATIMERVSEFTNALRGAIDGTSDKWFVQKNRERYDLFNTQVSQTAPDFRNQSGALYEWVDGYQFERPPPLALDDVRKAIQRHITWELPGYVSFDTTKELLLRHIQLWEMPLTSLFEDVREATLSLIDRLIQVPGHFGPLFELKIFVGLLVREEQDRLRNEASETLKKLFKWETVPPIQTANRAIYDQTRSAWLSDQHRNHGHYPGYGDEYKVMADVHAYFQVASARFVDEVIQSIETEWHQCLVVRLRRKLFETFPVLSAENLADLVKEDPEIARRRETLTGRVEQLEKIKARLLEFEREARGGIEDDYADLETPISSPTRSPYLSIPPPPLIGREEVEEVFEEWPPERRRMGVRQTVAAFMPEVAP